MKQHLGVSSKKVQMPVIQGYDENDDPLWKEITVEDQLRICEDDKQEIRFHLGTPTSPDRRGW